ncbi:hypothetical protein SBRCBS47491_007894 [Sporothrix bragantina]|uniref:Uncharacterized protein n=1 Tax=Sporothrix bragantina TaxID=671064 RepID=A0ABP0CJH5_9PEZI
MASPHPLSALDSLVEAATTAQTAEAAGPSRRSMPVGVSEPLPEDAPQTLADDGPPAAGPAAATPQPDPHRPSAGRLAEARKQAAVDQLQHQVLVLEAKLCATKKMLANEKVILDLLKKNTASIPDDDDVE